MTSHSTSRDAGTPHRIWVVGIGGAGCRAVDRMSDAWTEGPQTAAISTNVATIESSRATVKIQIGEKIAKGFSAGGDPNVGRLAAEDDADKLRQFFANVDLAFLVVGLGGGTGTGAAPAVARMAREAGSTVLCMATLPFNFEGDSRRQKAQRGLDVLKAEADAVIVVPNERLFELVRDQPGAEAAFRKADEVLGTGIHSIWNLVVRRGLINLDFADLRNVVQNSSGTSVFGHGEGSGPEKATQAAQAALSSPLLEGGRSVAGAHALLVSIIGGPDLALGEIETIMRAIADAAPKNAHMSMGAATHPDLKGRISVTLVASERWSARAEEPPAAAADPAGTAEPSAETAVADPTGFKRKRRSKTTQTKLALEPTGRGRFKDVEPTILDGEDLDIPTFLRRGITVEKS